MKRKINFFPNSLNKTQDLFESINTRFRVNATYWSQKFFSTAAHKQLTYQPCFFFALLKKCTFLQIFSLQLLPRWLLRCVGLDMNFFFLKNYNNIQKQKKRKLFQFFLFSLSLFLKKWTQMHKATKACHALHPKEWQKKLCTKRRSPSEIPINLLLPYFYLLNQ